MKNHQVLKNQHFMHTKTVPADYIISGLKKKARCHDKTKVSVEVKGRTPSVPKWNVLPINHQTYFRQNSIHRGTHPKKGLP